MKNKGLFLGIVHIHQVHTPTTKEIMQIPECYEIIKEALPLCKKAKDLAKIVKTLQRQGQKKVIQEQVYITDRIKHQEMVKFEYLIDIDEEKLLKCRGNDISVTEYLERYKDKIQQFRDTYVKKD